MTSDYQWTVASALYQLRWEPTGRRASATAYLREAITTGPEQQARDIACTLLSMTEPDEGDDVYQYQAIQGTCAVCHGPLEQSERYPAAGLLHVNDADDTHVPVMHSALCSSRITGEDRCNCVRPEDRTT